jgi:hypothetical protein
MPSSRSRRSRQSLNRRSSATTFTGPQQQPSQDSLAAHAPKPAYLPRAYSQSYIHDENHPDGLAHLSDHDEPRPTLLRPSSGRRLTYSSLPSTPITGTPPIIPQTPPLLHYHEPTSPTVPDAPQEAPAPFSLWDYLREELLATDFESHQELKWDRVSNFLSIPLVMEKVRTMLSGAARKC